MTFYGIIADHRIQLGDAAAFSQQIRRLEGCQIEIRLAKRKKIRSLDANAYYWGVCIKYLAEYTGYEPDELHDALKARFLTDNSGKLPRVRSTASLDTKEFSEYVDNVIRVAAEPGVVIPPAEAVA